MMQLSDKTEDNIARWAGLPPIYWTSRVTRSKPAAEVLLVDADPTRATRSGKMPIIATQQYGMGHVMFVGTDNTWRWRMTPRRLEAEAIRDAMLAVSGALNLYPVDGSPVARAGEGREGLINLSREVMGRPFNYRSIYLPIVRDQIPEFLNVFDFPDASLVSGERDSTNVPGQSLFLMNNPQVLALADAFAQRIAAHEGDGPQRLAYAYELVFARPPTASEMEAIRRFWQEFPRQATAGRSTREAQEQARSAALSAFCQGLFASAEFRYLN
jgi:hypothetical protein